VPVVYLGVIMVDSVRKATYQLMLFYFCQAVDALRNSPIIAQLVVEKGTAEDLLTNSSGPPTPQESRYGAVQYSHYHASSDSYNGKNRKICK